MSKIRTLVTFKSTAFNTSDPKDYFINPGCYGDDLAEWLLSELRKQGLKTAERPEQEDFGWYFSFRSGDTEHDFVIGYRPDGGGEEGSWVGWLERRVGLLASLLGRRKHGIESAATEQIHEVLSGAAQIQDVRWHFQRDFEEGREELGVPQPDEGR